MPPMTIFLPVHGHRQAQGRGGNLSLTQTPKKPVTAWIKAFSAHAAASGKSSAEFSKQLGARLASSNPQELFLPHEFQDKKLFQGTLANAWAGACVFCRPAWLPDTVISLDISKKLNKPSKWWTNLSAGAYHNVIPFSSADLFSDASDSTHDLERLLRKEFGPASSPKLVDPQEWFSAFSLIKNKDWAARSTLIELAMTPNSVFSPYWFADPADQTKLTAVSIANFWVGAHLLAGAPWSALADDDVMAESPVKIKTPSPTDMLEEPSATTGPQVKISVDSKPLVSDLKSKNSTRKPGDSSSKVQSEGVSFGAGAKSGSLFLSRGPRKPAPVQDNPEADERKHEDICHSIELPLIDSDWKEAGAELTSHFVAMVDHIFATDKKALIHQ
jgi:hypothetical protein